jgi:hypothetical protein
LDFRIFSRGVIFLRIILSTLDSLAPLNPQLPATHIQSITQTTGKPIIEKKTTNMEAFFLVPENYLFQPIFDSNYTIDFTISTEFGSPVYKSQKH